MNQLSINDVRNYVEINIGEFHQKRLEKLNTINLKDLLKRKNPYLFKAKNIQTASELVKGLVDAFVSSSEEGMFGNWLEGLAIYINSKVYNGRKSGIPGVDLEFEKNDIRYIVSIKSGPNWGNNDQKKKMIANFDSARKILKTSGSEVTVSAINGCCYGKTTVKNNYQQTGDYHKYCGQVFWEFISGNNELYKEIVEPLGHLAFEKNKEFDILYSQKINQFTKELFNDFLTVESGINWDKLLEFNSKGSKE